MRVSVALVILACACPAMYGQPLEAALSGGVSNLGNKSLGTDLATGNAYSLTDGFRLAFTMTLNTGLYYGHEVGYAYNRTNLHLDTGAAVQEQGMAFHQGGYNFLGYATKEGKRLRPFATAGVHFNNYIPPGSSVTQGGGSTKFGFNYGAGLKVRLIEPFQMRFDLRQYQNTKPFDVPGKSGLIRQTAITVGFGIAL